MSAEVFSEWLKLQGHTIIKTHSSFWFNQGPRVYQAFPYHWLIYPDEEELNELFFSKRAIALRYTTLPHDCSCFHSYHVVYDKTEYHLANLKKAARSAVRQGLKLSSVSQISFDLLSEDGWDVYVDTLLRQNRDLYFSHSEWRKRCLYASNLPGFEVWGSFVDGELAATMLTFQIEDWCYILEQYSRQQHLKSRVNNVLTYVVTDLMISRPDIHSVFYGLQSLDASSSVDKFKFGMGYDAKPVRQCVRFHPGVRPLVNKASLVLVKAALRLLPKNRFLRKAEGMFRFYLLN